MNDCTRLSHSFWRSDMVKSIGRSSHSWDEIVGGTVSPPPVHCKSVYRGAGPCEDRLQRARRSGDASRALTFRPSNHSFIQMFEMQCPTPRSVKCRQTG